MSRTLLWWGLIGVSCISAPTTWAQDNDIRVQLFAFAEFSFYFERRDRVQYPSITEYREFSDWVHNPYHDSRSPGVFDLVAVVENLGTRVVESFDLELTRNRKISEPISYDNFRRPPYQMESARWEGSIPVETKPIGTLDGKTATVVRFGPFSVRDLWEDLELRDLWPWEVRYEVTVRCNDCTSYTGSATFTMWPPL